MKLVQQVLEQLHLVLLLLAEMLLEHHLHLVAVDQETLEPQHNWDIS